jgi:diketogulonate reductase-like aldo/keto reductase
VPVPTPKSVKLEHIEEIFQGQDFVLDTNEIALINAIEMKRRIIDPGGISPK